MIPARWIDDEQVTHDDIDPTDGSRNETEGCWYTITACGLVVTGWLHWSQATKPGPSYVVNMVVTDHETTCLVCLEARA